MSTKSREVIWGGRIMGADIHAKAARETAQKAIREADRAEAIREAEAWERKRRAAEAEKRTAAQKSTSESGRFLGFLVALVVTMMLVVIYLKYSDSVPQLMSRPIPNGHSSFPLSASNPFAKQQ